MTPVPAVCEGGVLAGVVGVRQPLRRAMAVRGHGPKTDRSRPRQGDPDQMERLAAEDEVETWAQEGHSRHWAIGVTAPVACPAGAPGGRGDANVPGGGHTGRYRQRDLCAAVDSVGERCQPNNRYVRHVDETRTGHHDSVPARCGTNIGGDAVTVGMPWADAVEAKDSKHQTAKLIARPKLRKRLSPRPISCSLVVKTIDASSVR